MNPILLRGEYGDQGVFGRFIYESLNLYSGELPYRDNRSNVSCLPSPGLHPVEWTWSPAFKMFMYLLLDTAPRAGIRAHSANLMGDKEKGYKAQLNGCIAFGERLGWIDGQKALLLSSPAVRRFEDYMGHKPFMLEIR